MGLVIEAACGCHTGKVRKNNEDNVFFGGKCLEEVHDSLEKPLSICIPAKSRPCFAVFDGMGGENFGEIASYTAAHRMQRAGKTLISDWMPPEKYLNKLTIRLNNAVVRRENELQTNRMGTTMVTLYFTAQSVFSCNVGDSRAYRLRDGELLQISVDHLEVNPRRPDRKAPLTQHLGIDPMYMMIEPYVEKYELKHGDQYLLCSDGLTDMLTDMEISDIMKRAGNLEECTETLIQTALTHGGRDNITVIVCSVAEKEGQR